MVNILSFDGGPGPLLQLRILRKLVDDQPQLLDEVDLFAGTSDGALVGLYLAHALQNRNGRSVAQIVDDCIDFTRAYSAACNTGVLGLARRKTVRPPKARTNATWRNAK